MAHTIEEKKKLLVRLNRIHGQLQSIKEAIEEEKECSQVLQQIAACRGAMGGLLAEIIEGEIRYHVLPKDSRTNSPEMKAAEHLVEVLHRYLK